MSEFTYEVNKETGTTTARGELEINKASRSQMKKAFTGKDKLATDDRGHLVVARFDGKAIPENLFGQNRNVNRIDFKHVENAEAKALKQGATIDTERTAFISNGTRPDNFMINDTVTFQNGVTEELHYSFTNMSHAEMEELNEISSDYMFDDPNPGDTLRDMMSVEEYSTLMTETDAELPGIAQDFQYPVDEPSVDTTTSSTANASTSASTSAGASASSSSD